MALILLLETATVSCSVALAEDGEIIAAKELDERNAHASHITLFVQKVLEQGGKTMPELDAVAVSMGPGSYTGLRIGTSTAKGLCYALDIPLIAVNTLQSMAGNIASSGEYPGSLYCPMIDARRMEVYTAVYDEDLREVLPVQARIIDNNSFRELLKNNRIIFFGDGALKCSDVLKDPNAIILPGFVNSARDMREAAARKYRTGDFEDLAYFEPFYLKDFLVAAKPKGH